MKALVREIYLKKIKKALASKSKCPLHARMLRAENFRMKYPDIPSNN